MPPPRPRPGELPADGGSLLMNEAGIGGGRASLRFQDVQSDHRCR